VSGPEQIRDEWIQVCAPRRRWLFVRVEVVLCGSQERQTHLPHLNADESERHFQRQADHLQGPHQMLEGMIIACYANDVHLAHIYIRGEFMKAPASERGAEKLCAQFPGKISSDPATISKSTCTGSRGSSRRGNRLIESLKASGPPADRRISRQCWASTCALLSSTTWRHSAR
jgi:hypothetical protein